MANTVTTLRRVRITERRTEVNSTRKTRLRHGIRKMRRALEASRLITAMNVESISPQGADLRFTGMPNFAPEILRRVRLQDPIRAKQMRRALEDLAEEGVAQIFRPTQGSDWIVGVVGPLQFEVLSARIEAE